MSFDLFVYVPTLPADLIPLWEAQLARHGLICSFYPGFHPVTTPDNFIPVQVRVVPGAFPLADRYGAAPLYAELELDYEVASGEYFPEWQASAFQYAPATLHSYLEQASCCLYFRTAAGRTLIEFRLQYSRRRHLRSSPMGSLTIRKRDSILWAQTRYRKQQ